MEVNIDNNFVVLSYLSLTQIASSGGLDPASKPVSNITSIAMRSNAILQVATRCYGTRVVYSGSLVVLADIIAATLADALLQTIA